VTGLLALDHSLLSPQDPLEHMINHATHRSISSVARAKLGLTQVENLPENIIF
jgi:hypothetical protein